MKLIDTVLLDSLSGKAAESGRRRAHFNLHPELNDAVQRLCIAMEPETYVQPHRHADPPTWEVLMILRGSLVFNVFDDQGTVIDRVVLKAGGPVIAVEFPQNTWHAPASLEPGTIVFEIKQGPYRHPEEKNLAPWAPNEGEPAAGKFCEWYRRANVGDRPPHRD